MHHLRLRDITEQLFNLGRRFAAQQPGFRARIVGQPARNFPPRRIAHRFPWAASGRAIANGRDEGFTKLLFDDSPEAHGHGRILGGGIVGTHAGDMIGEIALAIEMGADAVDIGKTIHPHPTLGESIGMAAEIAHGSCTDVPPARK
ncbi:hypothetical protein [Sphingobium sp. TKS]|uniref:hypothetical protein n=1 Tax=Sphingobium sp. TKS TaxID=1315974 RepID=UPI00077035A2|nr:dihydrolipoamide dehydrogenase [Sphingobium sp. TKS]